jgi:two-component system response regulator LytT
LILKIYNSFGKEKVVNMEIKLKVLIIEDEQHASERLKRLLIEIDPSIEIIGCLETVRSAICFLTTNKNDLPDLIMLDINLADGSSFEIFNQMKVSTPVIFTTAYDEYALKAFKLNSIDYLLKPVKSEDLVSAIRKFRYISSIKNPIEIDYSKLAKYISEHKKEYKERLVTRMGGLLKTINISDAAYFYTENKITYVCTIQRNKLAVDETLEELEEILNPKFFFRINRQFIINIDSIEKMIVVSKSRVKLFLNPPAEFETIASTDRSSQFKKWLAG